MRNIAFIKTTQAMPPGTAFFFSRTGRTVGFFISGNLLNKQYDIHRFFERKNGGKS